MRLLNTGAKTPGGKARWRHDEYVNGERVLCYQTTNPDAPYRDQGSRAKKADRNPQFRRKLGKRAFLVTWAQNATPVHDGFKGAVDTFLRCNEHVELVVIPGRYKNATSQWTQSQENAEWWAPELAPYLYNQRKKLNDSIVLLGDLKVQPTRTHPLTGKEGMTYGESGIVGHPKLQLLTLPTLADKLPKIMVTTGAITKANYTDTDAGKRGEFHHVLGACLVELENRSKFHLRQINAAADGSFIDWDTEYLPTGEVRKAAPALALVMGDTHVRFIDKKVEEATFGKGGIVEQLNPGTLVWHDLLDGYAVNPHARRAADPFAAQAKFQARMCDVRDEVVEAVRFLCERTGSRRSVVVPSNHNDFLRRWLVDEDWRRDPQNAEFYLETALHMVRSSRMTGGGAAYDDPFIWWVEKLKTNGNVRCLSWDESFPLARIELGQHGHLGPNGSRGSPRGLSKIGTKMVDGHSHSPSIIDGHMRVGTSTELRLEYMRGPSGHLNTHAVVYANGKRTLVNIIDGKFRCSR